MQWQSFGKPSSLQSIDRNEVSLQSKLKDKIDINYDFFQTQKHLKSFCRFLSLSERRRRFLCEFL